MMMADKATDTRRNDSAETNRRRMLELLGVGVLGGLAGCTSDSGGSGSPTRTQTSGTDSSGSESPTEPQSPATDSRGTSSPTGTQTSGTVEFPDRQFTIPISFDKGNLQNTNWNIRGKNFIGEQALIKARFVKFDPKENSLVPWTADYTVTDDNVLRIEMLENMKWSTGEQITGRDLAVNFVPMANPNSDSTLGEIVESLEVVSDDPPAIEMPLSGSISERNAGFALYGKSLNFNWAQFGEYFEPVWKGNDSEREQALQELANYHLPPEDVKASGMFKPQEVRPKRIIYSRNDNFMHSDHINFGQAVLRDYGSVQQQWASLQSGQNDYMSYQPVQQLGAQTQNVPSSIAKSVISGAGNISLVPQHLDSQLGDLAVRKAIAYLLDRNAIAENCGTYFTGAPLYTGSSGPVQEEFIGESRNDFTQYGKTSKPEQATQVLNEADYTKEGGEWYDPDGNRVNTSIICKSSGYWSTGARTAASQMRNFGFESTARIMEDTAYWNTFESGQFNKIAVGWWGHGSAQLPYFQYWMTLFRQNPGKVAHWGMQFNQKDSATTPIQGTPAGTPTGGSLTASEKAKVPMPVGDPSGDEQVINVQEKVNKLLTVGDEETVKRLVTELGWMYNQHLPQFPMINGEIPHLVNKRGWDVPDLDSEPWSNYKYAETGNFVRTLWRNGELKATETE